MYIDYPMYLALGGTAAEAAFPRLEFMARKKIDHFSLSRVAAMSEVPEAVKMLSAEIINIYAKASLSETAGTLQLTGFSNGKYSESYGNHVTAEAVEDGIAALIYDYLSGVTDNLGVPLLYMGVS